MLFEGAGQVEVGGGQIPSRPPRPLKEGILCPEGTGSHQRGHRPAEGGGALPDSGSQHHSG